MDILEYEREIEEKIEELRNEIDSLREEKLATPEYEKDIQADIRNCLIEIEELEDELEKKEYLNWESDKEGEEREWENSRL